MESLLPQSVKIQKKKRSTSQTHRLYICGGCEKAYKSYPALYLHIKRKHNGIRPLNTKTAKPNVEFNREVTHTGRPQKPARDVDDIPQKEVYLEDIQSELLDFIGEKLGSISTFDSKPKLNELIQVVNSVDIDLEDEWLTHLKREVEKLLMQKKEHSFENTSLGLDYEEFKSKSSGDPLQLLGWLIVWFGQVIVKPNFLPDLVLIFSRVWMVLKKKDLVIQDLDNKLVWKEVTKECLPIISKLVYFKNNKDLIYEFVEKSCHLIGKTFE